MATHRLNLLTKFLQTRPNGGNMQKSHSNIDTSDSTNEDCKTEKTVIFKSNMFLLFFFVFLSSVILALNSVLVKKLAYINPGQLAFARTLGVFAGSLPIEIYSVRNILEENDSRLLLLFRGALGGFAFYLDAVSFSYLPIAEATIIVCSLPIVTSVLARVALREACGLIHTLLLITAVCGVLLAVNLPGMLSERGEVKLDNTYILGIAASVTTVLLGATIYVVLRKLKHIHFSSAMISYGFMGMIVNGIITLATSKFVQPNCGWDIILFILVPVFGFLGNILTTLAFQKMDAGIATTLLTMRIPIALIFQIVFFYKVPNIFNICGGLLVMLAVVVLGVRNYGLNLPKQSNIRKRLKFLLF